MLSRHARISALVVFIVVAIATGNKFCQLQCYENITNTVCDRNDQKCGPGANCGLDFRVIKLTDDDRQYILDVHNYLRNKVALGKEKRGGQPSASDMLSMSYDRELEFMAQCWANACNGNPLVHDTCRRTAKYEYVGQNLGSISSTLPNIDLVKSLKELMLGWYDEVADFDSTWINDTKPREKETGHYTQLVWASTNKIGCAVSYYSFFSEGLKWYVLLLVCDYGPSGNFLSTPVYQVGEPRTRCPPLEMSKNKKYRGLCGVDRKVTDSEQYEDVVFDDEVYESTGISMTIDESTVISTIAGFENYESTQESTTTEVESDVTTQVSTTAGVESDESTEMSTTTMYIN